MIGLDLDELECFKNDNTNININSYLNNLNKRENKKNKSSKKKDEDEESNSDEDDKNKKNQLFQQEPPLEFVKNIMEIFLGKNINNPYYQFSRKMIEEKKIIEKLNTLIPELKKYYLKCKYKKYLENIDSKKSITIFRQLIRVHGYKIRSIEKYQNGSKFLLYNVINTNKNKSPKKYELVVDFD